jgi:hypothetical protein
MKTTSTLGLIAIASILAACAAPAPPSSSDTGSGTDDGSGDGTGDDGTTTDQNGTDPSDPNGNGNGSTNTPDPGAPPAAALDGITISKISFFQAVQVDVMKGGTWVTSRNAPLVANRPAIIRIHVTLDSSWRAQPVTAEVRLASASKKFPVITATASSISKASTDADTSSTINVELPADSLPKDATMVVSLTGKGASNTGTSPARYPNDGTPKALGLQTSGKVRVVVVPVKYMADGSGRVPDTSTNQLALYKNLMMARYPAADVDVTVRAPWNYTAAIGASGSGFSQVLQAVTNLRKTDGVTGDVYYYGALAPSSSFNSFCGSGCVTGLSTVVDDPSISQMRASVGIGYTGYDSANTMAHEVGHAHGRNHAPCGGAQGVDPDFPYSSGGIGVMGYDIVDKSWISATQGKDMMGYCQPEWVSDYTYSALFDRVSAVAGMYAGSAAPSSSSMTTGSKSFRMASIDETGAMSWTDEYSSDNDPKGGQDRTVELVDAQGKTVATHTARFYPYDHLPGGVLIMPSDPLTVAKMRVPTTTTWTHVRVPGVKQLVAR